MEIFVLYFALVLARVGVFVAVLPTFGGAGTPKMVKAGLALALTVMYMGSLFDNVPTSQLFSQALHPTYFGLGLALMREALLGVLLGYAFGLFLVPAHVAGEFLTQELGLSFGAYLDPSGTGSAGSLTQIIEGLAAIIFFSMDGHHICLATLHGSFSQYPIGGTVPQIPVQHLVAGATSAVEWGLLLALPMALCMFLVTVVLAFLTRAVPQLNLFTIGFPLRIGAGFGAILLLSPSWVPALEGIFGRVSELILGLT